MAVNQKDPSFNLAVDLHGFFREALSVALSERRVEASEPTAQYLVALLADFAKPDELTCETLDRPLAFLLEDALATTGQERFDRLRVLGDSVLYTSGFFLDHLQNRGVQLDYVSTLGARAYGCAATMLRHAGQAAGDETQQAPALFDELAGKFTRFAEVLGTVADGLFANAAPHTGSGMLRLYERWRRTGSTQLASTLAVHGLVPTRGKGGVH